MRTINLIERAKHVVIRLAAVGVGLGAGPAFGVDSTEAFYTQVERGVVRLERKISGVAGDEYCPVGTGFFVMNERDETFLVTARHVATVGDLRARVPTLLEASGKTDVVELRLPAARWVLNKNAGDERTSAVDVAVMKLANIPGGRTVVTFRYCPTDCGPGRYNQVANDPVPPDQVVIFGFPLDVAFTAKEQRPVSRFGIVALTMDESAFTVMTEPKVEKVLPKGVYLVDARMFGGNSGGPVVVMNRFEPLRLGGLVTASTAGLDLGIVTPVSQIADTLEQAKDTVAPIGTWFTLDGSVGRDGPMFGAERAAWLSRCAMSQ